MNWSICNLPICWNRGRMAICNYVFANWNSVFENYTICNCACAKINEKEVLVWRYSPVAK